jgi:hypothetical protein
MYEAALVLCKAMADPRVLDALPAGPLARLVDDYLANRRARELSRKTIANYELALQRVLLPWLDRQGIVSIGKLTSRDLDRLAAELLDQAALLP